MMPINKENELCFKSVGTYKKSPKSGSRRSWTCVDWTNHLDRDEKDAFQMVNGPRGKMSTCRTCVSSSYKRVLRTETRKPPEVRWRRRHSDQSKDDGRTHEGTTSMCVQMYVVH